MIVFKSKKANRFVQTTLVTNSSFVCPLIIPNFIYFIQNSTKQFISSTFQCQIGILLERHCCGTKWGKQNSILLLQYCLISLPDHTQWHIERFVWLFSNGPHNFRLKTKHDFIFVISTSFILDTLFSFGCNSLLELNEMLVSVPPFINPCNLNISPKILGLNGNGVYTWRAEAQ